MAPRIMKARYPGRCGRCGKDIAPGETIAWEKIRISSVTRCIPCNTMDDLDKRAAVVEREPPKTELEFQIELKSLRRDRGRLRRPRGRYGAAR